MIVSRKNRGGYTLAELIMAIALLAFFSTMIVQVFAQAQKVTLRSDNLDRAVICASDLADRWKQSAAELEPPVQIGPLVLEPEQAAVIWLDEAFEPCIESEALYQAVLLLEQGSAEHFWLLTVAIHRYPEDGGQPIYALQAGHYGAVRRGGP